MKEKMDHRLKEAFRALGGVTEVWKTGNLSMGLKKRIYESMIMKELILIVFFQFFLFFLKLKGSLINLPFMFLSINRAIGFNYYN